MSAKQAIKNEIYVYSSFLAVLLAFLVFLVP